MLNIGELKIASNGKIINGQNNYVPQNYVIDSREVIQGDFFVPIVGERTDGHKYIINTVKQGACGFFIDKNYSDKDNVIKESICINDKICIIEVEDTKKALYECGKYNRNKHIDIPVIAVTGSVGKTSTREMIASVLRTEKNVLVTKKNYNSYIGIPIMTLRMDNQDVCVLEAGIDMFGEMELESELLKPDVAVITMIGTAHISTFKSRDVIFSEKLKITNNIKGLKKLVVNNGDQYLSTLKNSEKYDILKYSLNEAKNIKKEYHCITFESNIYDEQKVVTINQIGNHNILNALCAIKIGEIFGISQDNIIKGIANYKNFSRRMEIKRTTNGVNVIDDTYNASIDSVKSGLTTVNELNTNRKIAVLGDMLELGELSESLHSEIGRYFKNLNYDMLIVVGNKSINIFKEAKKYFNIKDIFYYDNKEDALAKINEIVKKDDLVYFKASNGMHFEELIENIK